MSGEQHEQRACGRHASDFPVSVVVRGGEERSPTPMKDWSLGGLSCAVPEAIQPGTAVTVRFPLLDELAQLDGHVAWCREDGAAYRLGIAFSDHDAAFRARMLEQVSCIEQYRRDVARDQGRTLDAEAAAAEWIEQFGAAFPR